MNEQIQQILERSKLNWNVSKSPLFVKIGEEYQPTPFVATTRDDTGEAFATFKGESYEVFQNQQLAELVYRISSRENLTVHNGGMFKGGGQVYIQLDNGDSKVNGDTVKNFISAINSFDGSTSLRWGYSNITIVCQNTFWATYRSLRQQNSLKHTTNIEKSVEEALIEIETVRAIQLEMITAFQRLAEIAMNQKHLEKVIKSVTGVDIKRTEDYPQVTINKMNNLITSINHEVEQKGNTLWGLFSGVTHYTTHVYSRSADARAQSKVFGVANRIDNKVLEILS